MNGIANTGAAVGSVINNNGNFSNFVRIPNGWDTILNINGSTNAMAFGTNSAGDVVGSVNANAFFLPPGGPVGMLTTPGTPSTAFGISDLGNIVGQYSSGLFMPGFFLETSSGTNFITLNAPGGPNIINAQGVNDNGLIVGFYEAQMDKTMGSTPMFQTRLAAN